MVFLGAAAPIDNLSILAPDRIDLPFALHSLEGSVDGGQPDRPSSRPYVVEQFLRAAEAIGFTQGFGYRPALSSVPHRFFTEEIAAAIMKQPIKVRTIVAAGSTSR